MLKYIKPKWNQSEINSKPKMNDWMMPPSWIEESPHPTVTILGIKIPDDDVPVYGYNWHDVNKLDDKHNVPLQLSCKVTKKWMDIFWEILQIRRENGDLDSWGAKFHTDEFVSTKEHTVIDIRFTTLQEVDEMSDLLVDMVYSTTLLHNYRVWMNTRILVHRSKMRGKLRHNARQIKFERSK